MSLKQGAISYILIKTFAIYLSQTSALMIARKPCLVWGTAFQVRCDLAVENQEESSRNDPEIEERKFMMNMLQN